MLAMVIKAESLLQFWLATGYLGKDIASLSVLSSTFDVASLQMRNCIISERPCLTAAEFYHTLEVLQKLIVPQVPSNVAFGVQQLIDTARSQHQ